MPAPRPARLLDVDERDLAALPPESGPLLLVVRRDGVPTGSLVLEDGSPARPLADAVTWRTGPPLAGPGPSAVTVTVAVCTRNRPERLRRCLDSIDAAVATAGHEVAASVLVVDN